jgi:hypothetical protein
MTSDHKIDIDEKVKNVTDYIISGTFRDIVKYNNLIQKNNKIMKKNITYNIIVPEKLTTVKSKHRGAISFGYRFTPCVIAINENYVFGCTNSNNIGTKYTIAQYSSGYANFEKIFTDLNRLEKGWGGSNVIIGSPQTHSSKLKIETIIDVVKKHLF